MYEITPHSNHYLFLACSFQILATALGVTSSLSDAILSCVLVQACTQHALLYRTLLQEENNLTYRY